MPKIQIFKILFLLVQLSVHSHMKSTRIATFMVSLVSLVCGAVDKRRIFAMNGVPVLELSSGKNTLKPHCTALNINGRYTCSLSYWKVTTAWGPDWLLEFLLIDPYFKVLYFYCCFYEVWFTVDCFYEIIFMKICFFNILSHNSLKFFKRRAVNKSMMFIISLI